MKVLRGASQILFGFLPEQTVDLEGRVWKVAEWLNPYAAQVDDLGLREALLREVAPWRALGTDNGYADDLQRGRPIDVRTLNRSAGVRVDAYPRVWICSACGRAADNELAACRCGKRAWSSFHFVGYHDCGALFVPRIGRCAVHDDVRVRFPGTASAAEILMDCPECGAVVQRGLGAFRCGCGGGVVRFTVHRAASVYTPRTVVMVNAASPIKLRQVMEAGGPSAALAWALEGMTHHGLSAGKQTRSSFVDTLVAKGIAPEMASSFADQAVASGSVLPDARGPGWGLTPEARERGEVEALTIATATWGTRTTIDDLIERTVEGTSLGDAYRRRYRAALGAAGFLGVDFIDRFPVLTGMYGYTRGGGVPGEGHLMPFKGSGGRYAVYAENVETEALLVRLRGVDVAKWMEMRGFKLPTWTDESSARVAILASCQMPMAGVPPQATPGSALLTLVHSLSHRLIRRTSQLAGIERSSLSELLVPLHLGFFIFAVNRGNFVLGGLHALFETELDLLLNDFVLGEHRCALDPGCERCGAACACCLHLGEPSCRYYNGSLDRLSIGGARGYLANLSPPS